MPALLFLGGLLLVLVLAELGARAWIRGRGRYFVREPFSRTLMPLDPAVFPTCDPLVRFDSNRLGERGSAPPRNFARTFRILVGGGSAAECFYIDQPSTWPEALGRELSTPAALARLQRPAVHVGNVALSLTDCRAQVQLFSRILPRLPRSDVTLLMTGAADLVRWLEDHAPPSITETPIPASSLFAVHPEARFAFTPNGLALRRAAVALKHRLLRPVERREMVGKRMAANRASRANAKRILTTIADPAPVLASYEKHLRQLVPLLQRHSARVLLLRQPWLERPFTPDEERLLWMFGDGRPYRETVTDYYDRALIYPILHRIDAVTEKVARELHVESLELRSRIPPDFEHYYDEMHNTPKGCALVGQIVAEAILAREPGR